MEIESVNNHKSEVFPLTDYLTEQEQIQQLKNWVKQYGLTILLGILISLAITASWRYWQHYHNRILTHASAVYDEMIAMRAQNNTKGTLIQARKLLSHYPKTPYAEMAALILARDAVINKNYVEAINQLNWVINHSKTPAMREIARIRIARILIAEKKPGEALILLKTLEDKSFIGMVDEVRGDAHLAKNDKASARKAYQLALEEIPNGEVTRPVLEMKFENLATEKNTAS